VTFGAGSEDINTHGFDDEVTNNTRITPSVAGYYELTCTYISSATTATSMRVTPGKNGGVVQPAIPHFPATTSGVKGIQTSAVASANGSTDYFEMFAVNSTGAINTQASGGFNCVFEVKFIGDLS
jgi:hypothetical protein